MVVCTSVRITPPSRIGRKNSVACRDQQVNNSELARRLGVHERVIRRMLDPEHASKPARIQATLADLGKQITVEVRDAA